MIPNAGRKTGSAFGAGEEEQSMDLVQLKYFVAVAEAGHLTNAAKKLNVAQPALSVSLARLEKEVGVPLFDRVGRNISLNKFGEIYLEYAEQALDRIRKA